MLAGMSLSGSVSAILLDRGPDMVYDTVLDITWTRQAGGQDGFTTGNWAAANAWAAALVFGGFNDWRLPNASVSAEVGPATTVVNCATATEAACRDNEMGYMFYYNLDGNFGDNKTGTQMAVGGEVLTGIDTVYSSGTDFDSRFAWAFDFFGFQGVLVKGLNGFAWAVRPGDVGLAAVPEPATLTLLGIALAAFGITCRQRSRRPCFERRECQIFCV